MEYTPFSYLIMAETTFISVLLPILLNPKLKRSKTDERDERKKQLLTETSFR